MITVIRVESVNHYAYLDRLDAEKIVLTADPNRTPAQIAALSERQLAAALDEALTRGAARKALESLTGDRDPRQSKPRETIITTAPAPPPDTAMYLINGRRWFADDPSHATEQHYDAFPDEPILSGPTRSTKPVPGRHANSSVCSLAALDVEDPRPPYRQVADTLRAAILAGELAPGERLPTQSELCKAYGLARMTIQQALRILKDEGLVSSVQGSGTFVRRRPAPPADPALDQVSAALAAFNQLRRDRDNYQPEGDWETKTFAFDEGLADLGTQLADTVTAMLEQQPRPVSPDR